jgi:hypothetical protein
MEIITSLILMSLFGLLGYFIAKKTNLNPIVWFVICFIFIFYGLLAEISWLIILKILNLLKTNSTQNQSYTTQQTSPSNTTPNSSFSTFRILGLGCLLVLIILAITVLLFVIGFDYLAFKVGSEIERTSNNINKFIE